MDFRAGQEWRVREDAKAICLLLFKAPFTDAKNVTIPAGEILTVDSAPCLGATKVSFTPKRYVDLMRLLVDPEDLADPKFGGYSLIIKFEEVARCCVLESGGP